LGSNQKAPSSLSITATKSKRLNWKTYRPALARAVLRVGVLIVVMGSAAALLHPDSPLPDEWNPLTPLDIAAPLSDLTDWKLRQALADDTLCHQVLEASGADITRQAPFEESGLCHIRPRVTLRAVGDARLAPVETRCQTALRIAMWERHGLQTAAERHMGSRVREIRHYSSYSCREMRTEAGRISRMSTHATADALDVSGFGLVNGEAVDLRRDWPGSGAKGAFLRDAFQAACLWFPVALGPEFNALHADHFHLQTTGWGLCR